MFDCMKWIDAYTANMKSRSQPFDPECNGASSVADGGESFDTRTLVELEYANESPNSIWELG